MDGLLNIMLSLAIGGLAGWAATRLFKADNRNSVFVYIAIGIIGAAVGRLLIKVAGFEAVGSGVVTEFIVAFIGASALVGLSKIVADRVLK